jgi:hypothetical protein
MDIKLSFVPWRWHGLLVKSVESLRAVYSLLLFKSQFQPFFQPDSHLLQSGFPLELIQTVPPEMVQG